MKTFYRNIVFTILFSVATMNLALAFDASNPTQPKETKLKLSAPTNHQQGAVSPSKVKSAVVKSDCVGKPDAYFCVSKTKLVSCVGGKVKASQTCNVLCNSNTNSCDSGATIEGSAESGAH